jgi:hypothetical protein
MKLFSLKTCVIIGFALSFLAIGSIILVRQKSGPSQPQHQYQRYPHEHLHTSEWEPKNKLDTVAYTLHKDDTLANVAKLRYGHRNYYRVIKLYNHIEDEGHIKADDKLRLPDMSVILTEEGLTRVAATEVGLILCSRAKYDKVVDRLWALRIQTDGTYVLPERIKQELLEAADDLEQATESLKSIKPGVSGVPVSMIGQLEQSMTGMRALAEGEHSDPNGYDIDIVQQRYALALTYAIIWAREGFK